MKINSADDFKVILEKNGDNQFLPNVEIDDCVWVDILKKYPNLEFIVIQYNVSPTVLAQLSRSVDYLIRWKVAEKRRLNLETFELLSNDKEYVIRREIAINKKCPKYILQKLSKDEHEEVSKIAQSRLRS